MIHFFECIIIDENRLFHTRIGHAEPSRFFELKILRSNRDFAYTRHNSARVFVQEMDKRKTITGEFAESTNCFTFFSKYG